MAEGVENEEQLAELKDIGCDLLQGFLIARPMGADEVTRWRASDRSVDAAAG